MTTNRLDDHVITPITYVCIFFLLSLAIPGVFIANADNRLTSAAFPDSGEIIQDLINLLFHGYDQTRPAHIALYGWFYNSIVFCEYFILNKIFLLDPKYYYPIFACLARFNSLIIASLVVVIYPIVLSYFIKRKFFIIWGTFCLILTQPFLLFTSQVHPDNLGVLSSLLTTYFLARYLEGKDTKHFNLAVVWALLAPACKQYYFVFTLSVFCFLFIHDFCYTQTDGMLTSIRKLMRKLLQPILLAIGILFLIHPYAFLKPSHFFARQAWLMGSGFSNGTLKSSMLNWINQFILQDPIIMGGLVAIVVVILLIIRQFFKMDAHAIPSKVFFSALLFMLGVYCVLQMVWILVSMKNESLHSFHYFLPIYPYLILFLAWVLSKIIEVCVLYRAKLYSVYHVLSIVIMVFATLLVSERMLYALWQVTHFARYYYTDGYFAREYLQTVDWQKMGITKASKVLYSTAIPIPDGIADQKINDWAFDVRLSTFHAAVLDWQPDVMVIDKKSALSNSDAFIRVAEELGLELKHVQKTMYPSDCATTSPALYMPLKTVLLCLHENFLLISGNPIKESVSRDEISFVVYGPKQQPRKTIGSVYNST